MPRKPQPAPVYPHPEWCGLIDNDTSKLHVAAALAAMPRAEFAAYLEDKTLTEQVVAMRLRFRFDRLWFLTYCWPDTFSLPFNAYHVDALSSPKRWWRHRVPVNMFEAVAAPRGIAKTTIAKGDICHDAVYGLEGMVVVHSAGLKEGAEPMARGIRDMLVNSKRLAALYGPASAWKEGIDLVLQVGAAPPLPVRARSFKTQVRGTNFKEQRPTKYVIDDGEHPDRVRNPVNRRQDFNFLYEDIASCGPRDGGLVISMRGTMLHADSLLMSTSKDPKWTYRRWQIMPKGPDRTDLWEQCRALWADLSDDDRRENALAFYQDNKEAMDQGAELLDPAAVPLFSVMEKLWTLGVTAFMKEQQNDVSTRLTTFFDMEGASRFEVEKDAFGHAFVRTGANHDVVSYVKDMQKIMYLDPVPATDLGALGVEGPGASDYACIVVLGKDAHGYLYVLDVWLKRAKDTEQVEAMFTLGKKWGCSKAYIEAVGFGRMVTRDFNRMRAERRDAGMFAEVRVEADSENYGVSKEDRIAKLEPVVNTTRWLRFNVALDPQAWEQIRDWPDGGYDDFPDALAGAYDRIGGAATQRRMASAQVR